MQDARTYLDVYVQGKRVTIQTVEGVEPTPFSLFFANMMRPRHSDEFAIDAGAGGGILAIALARLGVPRVVGVELNEHACEIFRENVRTNKVKDQVEIVHGDIADYDPPAAASLVVANPPTIPEHKGLPAFLSGGGPDGMRFLRLLLGRSGRWLAPDGTLQFVASSLVGWQRLSALAKEHKWKLVPEGTELVPFRSFYKVAFGTLGDGGTLEIQGASAAEDDERVFHQSEIITVYHAYRCPRTADR
jgi:methylase of polypeptide subunit release factors